MVHPVSPSVVSNAGENVRNVTEEGDSTERSSTPIVTENTSQNIDSSFISLLSEESQEYQSSVNDDEFEGAVGYSADSLELLVNRSFSQTTSTDSFNIQRRRTNASDNAENYQSFRRNSSMFSADDSDLQDNASSTENCQRSRNATSSTRDITDSGAILFHGFVRDEFHRQHIPEPVFLNSSFIPPSTLNRSLANDIIQAGNQLRRLSDNFAKSPLRSKVHEQAERVQLDTLTPESFSDILYGLFQEGGVTWERVLVLFFFCADVSIRAVRERLFGRFANVLEWSSRFFCCETFSRWIQDHGGWIKVLQDTVDHTYKIAVISFCTLSIIALSAYLWKNK